MAWERIGKLSARILNRLAVRQEARELQRGFPIGCAAKARGRGDAKSGQVTSPEQPTGKSGQACTCGCSRPGTEIKNGASDARRSGRRSVRLKGADAAASTRRKWNG